MKTQRCTVLHWSVRNCSCSSGLA